MDLLKRVFGVRDGDLCVQRLADAIASFPLGPGDPKRLAVAIDELVKTRVAEMMEVHLAGERNRLAMGSPKSEPIVPASNSLR